MHINTPAHHSTTPLAHAFPHKRNNSPSADNELFILIPPLPPRLFALYEFKTRDVPSWATLLTNTPSRVMDAFGLVSVATPQKQLLSRLFWVRNTKQKTSNRNQSVPIN